MEFDREYIKKISCLSERQRLFAEEYHTNGGDAQAAAIKAGYNKSGAGVQGGRALKNEKVQIYLAWLRKDDAKKFEITRENQSKKILQITQNMVKVMDACKEQLEDGVEATGKLDRLLLGQYTKANEVVLKCVETENKMFGVNEPDKVENTGELKIVWHEDRSDETPSETDNSS